MGYGFRRDRLPDEALAQLRTILDGYQRMRSNGAAGADQEVARLQSKLEKDPEHLWWSDIAQAQLCGLPFLEESELRARLGGWRRRLHEVAGDARYLEYLTTACDAKTAKKEQLCADLSECMRAVYYFYGAYGLSAKGRTDVTKTPFNGGVSHHYRSSRIGLCFFIA